MVATVLDDHVHARVVHPARVEVGAEEVEDRGLDVDAVETLDFIIEEATRGLPRAHAHHQHPAGFRMQQHRQMSGHDLMGLAILPLPQAIDQQALDAVPMHHREVRHLALAEVDERLSVRQEIRR